MESIGDAWGFSGKIPITLSRGFSVETLTGVTSSWKTKLNRSISAVKDRKPNGCNTTMRRVARKVATVEGRLACFGGDSTMEM